MTTFNYSAINAQGIELKGELQAPDLDAARDLLRQRGLLPKQARLEDARRSLRAPGFSKKIDPKALQIFSRQFATLIEAGVNVVTSLSILLDQTVDKNLKVVIEAVRTDVESGMIISKALAQHPNAFDRLYVSMVEAGEASGMLDRVLDRLAIQIEKSMQIKRRVKSAMVYPIVVLCFASLALMGMLLFLVPVFVNIFAQLNGHLPMLTQIVVDASNFLRDYWFIIFPLIGPLVLGFPPLEEDRARPPDVGHLQAAPPDEDRRHRPEGRDGALLADALDARRVGCRHRQGTRDHRQHLGELGDRAGTRRGTDEGARGHPDRPAADREPGVPADGQSDDQDRRGDGRAREDARQDRRLLRGRGRDLDQRPHLDHRAASR